MMSGKNRYDELRDCYTMQSEHFVHTRKKHRPEMKYIQQAMTTWLDNYENKKLHILEVGCGGGRTCTALQEVLPAKTKYTGIDFAQGMIDEAQKEAPMAQWLCRDMMEYLLQGADESIDCLLGVASVQHVKGSTQRALFFHHAYRSLARNGCMILTNRSFSDWFLKTYRSSWLISIVHCLRDKQAVWNDCFVPWKDYKGTGAVWKRYYHLFTLHELQQYALHAGFVIREIVYIAQDGTKTTDRRRSRNSFLVVQKAIA